MRRRAASSGRRPGSRRAASVDDGTQGEGLRLGSQRPFVVVIAGRPNAGKSTLFNRLLQRRRAIVHDSPGITRDDNRARIKVGGRLYELVDTGGIEEGAGGDGLSDRVRRKSMAVMSRADCVIYLLDGQSGLSPADRAVAREIRALGVPAIFAVNKVDVAGHESRRIDFFALGEGELLALSAAHGRGIEELLERLAVLAGTREGKNGDAGAGGEAGGAAPAEETAAPDAAPATSERPPRIALIGRPNVGKSSLLNQLAGRERVLVDPTPGTTRDAIDVEVRRGARRYAFVDTAGLRRPSRVAGEIETSAAQASLAALARADVAILVLDATQGITDQDLRLADLAWRRGRGLVVAVNKIDLAPALGAEECQTTIAERLPQWPPLAVVRVSALAGTGLRSLFGALDTAVAAYHRALPTARLNTLLRGAVAAHPPPLARGRAVKLLYATQVGLAPQAVTIFANHPESVPSSYLRYLTQALRGAFELVGVPLELKLRARSKTTGAAPRPRGESRSRLARPSPGPV